MHTTWMGLKMSGKCQPQRIYTLIDLCNSLEWERHREQISGYQGLGEGGDYFSRGSMEQGKVPHYGCAGGFTNL